MIRRNWVDDTKGRGYTNWKEMKKEELDRAILL
jgi:hypothetical protein